MSRSFLPDWVAKLFPRASRRDRRAARPAADRPAPLEAEALEDRVAPAVRIWTGLGADPNWTTAANWQGNVTPQAEDNLVFPATPVSALSVNNFGAGTRFRTITIADASYLIREAAPGANPITLLDGLVYNAPTSGAQLTIPVTLGANQTFVAANAGATITLGAISIPGLQTLAFDGRGNFDAEGVVGGTGGFVKLGDGTLILAANNTFQGLATLQ